MKQTFTLGLMLALSSIAFAQQQPATAPAQNSAAATPAPDSSAETRTTSVNSATTSAEIAHLRVYRHRRYMGSALAPSVYVDDQRIARVGNGRRFSMKLTPGPHIVRSDDKSSAISLDAKPGQAYYVRIDEEPGFWKGHGKLTLLMAEQGSAEYKLQKPVEGDRRAAKDLIEEDGEVASAQTEDHSKKK